MTNPTPADVERLIAEAEAALKEARDERGRYTSPEAIILVGLIAALRAMQAEKRELALDVLAASGQAQEAYEAQLAAEAKLAEVEKERDEWKSRHFKMRDDRDKANIAARNYSEFNHEWRKRADAAEATVATLTAQVEAMRGALKYYKDTFCEGFCGEDCWSDEGHSHPDIQRDCSGCLAASVLIRPATLTTENQTNG